jgi:hypothetical protein
MIYVIDDWQQLKRAYLHAIESDSSLPIDEQWRKVQYNGRLWFHIISYWRDGTSTGEYIPIADGCEEETPF